MDGNRCGQCSGSGRVSETEWVNVTCGRCGGLGYTLENCPVCHGTGVLGD